MGSSPVATTATTSPTLAPGVTPSPTPVGTTSTATPTGTATPTATPTATSAASTTAEKIYVVNHGQLGDNPSVTIFPATANGAATPLATIAGSNTMIAQPFFDVVDKSGTLYVSNQSNTPGNKTSGYITEYAAGDQSGNVKPTNTITGLDNPQGLSLDASGNLYVDVVDAIEVFAPGATGNATPIRTITGSMTTLQNLVLGGQPAGNAVDAAGNVFETSGPVILEFASGASGNVAPTNIFGGVNGGNDATTGPPYGSATLASCLSVAVDASDDLYCVNFNNSSFALFTSPSVPGVTVESTGASMPFGVYVDSTGQVFVTNYKSSTVLVFSSMAVFITGIPTSTITATAGSINYPYGVTAH